jgi:hypothetical protein
MAIQPPNNGLITETAEQYFQGSQGFRGDANNSNGQSFTTSFDTDLYLGDWSTAGVNYGLNNFKIYTSPTAIPGTWVEWVTAFTVASGKTITLTAAPGANQYIVVQLNILTGGKYASTEGEKAYGQTVEDNYGSYQYVKLKDIINNFIVGYVGAGKLIQNAKRTDVIFHAKRGLQEFSYDTLKSIKSSELTIPKSLTLVLPQDYVNYVKCSYVDQTGILHPIYPANNLTTSPFSTQAQDSAGIPTQDSFGNDIETESVTQARWHTANTSFLNGNNNFTNDLWAYNFNLIGDMGALWGRRYGIDPQYAQSNGWFNINEREGKLSFSSTLVDRLIVFEYVSDGLATDLDTKVPKLAEEAMYSYLMYALISTRINQPEYVVQRLRKEKSAKLRNAKIRLSNIKVEEITQVMRGKSKWIKT